MSNPFDVLLSHGHRISRSQAKHISALMAEEIQKKLMAKLHGERFLAGNCVYAACTVKFLDRENDAEEIARMRERGDPLVEL